MAQHRPVNDIEIARLCDLDTASLQQLWRRTSRKPVPQALTRELLIRVLAYKLQSARHSDLSLAARLRLKQAAQQAEAVLSTGSKQQKAASRFSRALQPGTRLLREWQGVMHEVIVVPNGYLWNGQVHRSLSVVARTITGTHWNGWVFFGVTPRKACGQELAERLVDSPAARLAPARTAKNL
jgi:hypothetical protein